MKICHLNITSKCNQKCVFCAAELEGQGEKMTLPFDTTLEEILRINGMNSGDKVVLSGGEPLLNPNIENCIRLLNDHQIKTVLFTNAVLLKDICRLKKLIELGVYEIDVPLVAVTENEYAYMTQSDWWLSYIEAIRNLNILRSEHNFRLGIKILLTRRLMKYSGSIVEFLKEKIDYADVIYLNGLIETDSAIRHDLIINYEKDADKVSDFIRELLERIDSKILVESVPLCFIKREVILLYLLKMRKWTEQVQDMATVLQTEGVTNSLLLMKKTERSAEYINCCTKTNCAYFKICKINSTLATRLNINLCEH